MDDRSVERAFRSLLPLEVVAPLASALFALYVLALVGMLSGASDLGFVLGFIPPCLACGIATALFARRHSIIATAVLVGIPVAHLLIATVTGESYAPIVVPLVTFFIVVPQAPIMILARVAGGLRAVDRGDTFIAWASAWCALVLGLAFSALGRISSAGPCSLFGIFVCLSLMGVALRRAWRRRELSSLAGEGELRGFRIRSDVLPSERENLSPLFGGNHEWTYAVLERFDGPSSARARLVPPPSVSPYRGPAPSPVVREPIFLGDPLGLVPV
jgi:hypothetical protein